MSLEKTALNYVEQSLSFWALEYHTLILFFLKENPYEIKV